MARGRGRAVATPLDPNCAVHAGASCGERPQGSRVGQAGRVRLAYIDESYDRERFVLAAVVVDPAGAALIGARLDELVAWAHRVFGVAPMAEIHAHHMLQGKGEWARLHGDPRARVALAQRAIAVISSADARVMVVVDDAWSGPWEGSRNPAPRYGACLDALVRRVEAHARAAGVPALIIADDVADADDYREDVLRLRLRPEVDAPSPRILDTIYFAPSRSSRLVQAADVVAHVARRVRAEEATTGRRRPATDLWVPLAARTTWASVAESTSAPGIRG